tara:strand:- start:1079 stop:2257 length:1179 start_codon:yes stop_codon:yes gene_type:complete
MANKSDYIYTDPTEVVLSSGETPYGIYDNDEAFASESINVTKWVARRLGHPVMQLEFDSGSIYAMFEESVSEYSTHINNYNIRNWMWNSYAADTKSTASLMGTGSFEPVTAHMGSAFVLSDQYGEAINVGGDVPLYSGSVTLVNSQSVYDLDTAVPDDHLTNRIEVQRVFNYGPAAITRFYDPFAGSFEQRQMLDAFGFGNVAPAVSFIMRPISYDIARAQAIETNDKVRKSNYSFELVNNQLRVFPIPLSSDAGAKIYFQYKLREDITNTTKTFTTGSVTDPSNVPHKFLTYNEINAPGRQWIRKFTLALSKELLGIIRSKYQSLPLPNGDVNMDGEQLKQEGREEKTQLLEELQTFLESVSLTQKAQNEAEEAEATSRVLARSPLGIYIG